MLDTRSEETQPYGLRRSRRRRRLLRALPPFEHVLMSVFWFIFSANNANINFREKEKKVLDQILGAGKYDARIRPSGINGTGEWCFCPSPSSMPLTGTIHF